MTDSNTFVNEEGHICEMSLRQNVPVVTITLCHREADGTITEMPVTPDTDLSGRTAG